MNPLDVPTSEVIPLDRVRTVGFSEPPTACISNRISIDGTVSSVFEVLRLQIVPQWTGA